MKFSYSAVWDDLVALLRANASLIAPIAGTFIFLPVLLLSFGLPLPVAPPGPATATEAANAFALWWQSVWYWYAAEAVVSMIGALAILLLVLTRGSITVGEAIAGAFALLPFYFIAALIAGAFIFLGFLLLIVPGLYLFGRLAPLPALVAGERLRNPIEAVQRTFSLTRGHGWSIIGLILLIAIPAWIAIFVVQALVGMLLIALAGQHVGLLLTLVVTAAAQAAFSSVLTLLYGALYRRLTKGI